MFNTACDNGQDSYIQNDFHCISFSVSVSDAFYVLVLLDKLRISGSEQAYTLHQVQKGSGHRGPCTDILEKSRNDVTWLFLREGNAFCTARQLDKEEHREPEKQGFCEKTLMEYKV